MLLCIFYQRDRLASSVIWKQAAWQILCTRKTRIHLSRLHHLRHAIVRAHLHARLNSLRSAINHTPWILILLIKVRHGTPWHTPKVLFKSAIDHTPGIFKWQSLFKVKKFLKDLLFQHYMILFFIFHESIMNSQYWDNLWDNFSKYT